MSEPPHTESDSPAPGPTPDVLPRFSPKRIAVWHTALFLVAIAIMVSGLFVANCQLHALSAEISTGPYAAELADVQANAAAARWTTTGVLAAALLVMLAVLFVSVKVGSRLVDVEFWIRRLGAGDLEYTIAATGDNEISRTLRDLETLRQSSIRAIRLDLVTQLSDELQQKNNALEQALEQLRQAQDQVVSQQKLMELQQLTAAIAHEISNPLNFVQNFAELSADLAPQIIEELQAAASLPDAQRENLCDLAADLEQNIRRILEHSARAANIIQGALKLGQATSGRYLPVDVNQLVHVFANAAYGTARRDADAVEIRIIEDFDPDAAEIIAVADDLSLVINQLVSNACYAMTRKAQETHDANAHDADAHDADTHNANAHDAYSPRLELATARNGKSLNITVRDNGIGIAEDILPRIFNPFFTTMPANQGAGLGLSLVHDVVREHGGTIAVRSDPGQFTEITITIPVDQPGLTDFQ